MKIGAKSRGRRHSEETRKKISERTKQAWLDALNRRVEENHD